MVQFIFLNKYSRFFYQLETFWVSKPEQIILWWSAILIIFMLQHRHTIYIK